MTADLARPRWVTAFLDVGSDDFEATVRFWSTVTGYAVSPARGDEGEFVSLLPPDGTDHLRLQRTTVAAPRLHLDLHVDDPVAAAGEAVEHGARLIEDLGYQVMQSPGGHPFCFVTAHQSTPAAPTRWPDGSSSLVEQVCLDLPAGIVQPETEFWQWITGWQVEEGRFDEFSGLTPPEGIQIRFLVQRLEEPVGMARSHLDISSDDREAERERHLAAGATLLSERGDWTVLADPSGMPYCLTDRDPATGRLPTLALSGCGH